MDQTDVFKRLEVGLKGYNRHRTGIDKTPIYNYDWGDKLLICKDAQ